VKLRRALFLLALVLSHPAASAAQGWRASVAAGRAVDDPVSARLGSNVASLGVDYADSVARWLYLRAGTPLGSPGPAWGAGGAGTWLGIERGALTVGASLGGHLFGWNAADSVEAGGGATVEVMPAVTFARGALRAELASGFVGTTGFSDSAGPARGLSESSARLIASVAPGVELSGEGRFLHAFDGDWRYAGVAAQAERGRWGAWGYAGSWLGRFPAPRTAYGVGASARFRRTRLEAGVRQEPMDPLYLSTPRRTWNVQLSRGFGRVPAAPVRGPQPPPLVLPAVANGVAVFRLPRSEYADAPALVGDFSRWQPVAMTAEGEWWTASVTLPTGVHHYGFRTAAGIFVVPAGARTVDDGFGGISAVLVVP
jgi:hypothetical protein